MTDILLAVIFAVLCLVAYGVFRLVWIGEELLDTFGLGVTDPTPEVPVIDRHPLDGSVDALRHTEDVMANRIRNGQHP